MNRNSAAFLYTELAGSHHMLSKPKQQIGFWEGFARSIILYDNLLLLKPWEVLATGKQV